MAVSEDGWPVHRTSKNLRLWKVVGVNGTKRHFYATNDVYGFLLAVAVIRFDKYVERLNRVWDLWGYAFRDVRGRSAYSNHAAGRAVDYNATSHPLGRRGTWSAAKIRVGKRIIAALLLGWGELFQNRKDGMHLFNPRGISKHRAGRAARRAAKTAAGKKVLALNPTFRLPKA